MQYLQKPVRLQQLFGSLFFETTKPTADSVSREQIGRPESVSPFAGRRVLVVEDNLVNQQVTFHQLKQFGIKSDIASNGREALSALQKTTYDLVFMDCQMPELDGYEATRLYRQSEAAGAHLPIIALSANAYPENQKRCLDVGMGDFISKPVKPSELERVMKEWMSNPPPPPSNPEATPRSVQSQPILDPAALTRLQMMVGENNSELFLEMVDLFLTENALSLSKLTQAVQEQDATSVLKLAHRLRGSSLQFGAGLMVHLCQAIEQKGRETNLDGLEELLNQLKYEFEQVQAVLQDVKKETNENPHRRR